MLVGYIDNKQIIYNESSHEMKYLQLVNLIADNNIIVTGLTLGQEPYSVEILDSVGNNITPELKIQIKLTGGFYNIIIYSSDILNAVQIKILY